MGSECTKEIAGREMNTVDQAEIYLPSIVYNDAEDLCLRARQNLGVLRAGLAGAEWHEETCRSLILMFDAMQQIYQVEPDGQLTVNEDAARLVDELGDVLELRTMLTSLAQQVALPVAVQFLRAVSCSEKTGLLEERKTDVFVL